MKKGSALTRIARLKTVANEAMETIKSTRYDESREEELKNALSLAGSTEKEILELKVLISISNSESFVEYEEESVSIADLLLLRQHTNNVMDRIKILLKLSESKVEEKREDGEWVYTKVESLLNRGVLMAKLKQARSESAKMDEIIQEHNWSTNVEKPE